MDWQLQPYPIVLLIIGLVAGLLILLQLTKDLFDSGSKAKTLFELSVSRAREIINGNKPEGNLVVGGQVSEIVSRRQNFYASFPLLKGIRLGTGAPVAWKEWGPRVPCEITLTPTDLQVIGMISFRIPVRKIMKLEGISGGLVVYSTNRKHPICLFSPRLPEVAAWLSKLNPDCVP